MNTLQAHGKRSRALALNRNRKTLAKIRLKETVQ